MIGEPLLGLTGIINVYQNKESSTNLIFPVKTTVMLMSLVTLILVSWLRIKLYGRNRNMSEENAVGNRPPKHNL